MKSATLFVIYLCLVGVIGCNQYVIDNLRAELIQARRATKASQKQAEQASYRANLAETKADVQIVLARKLRDEALKVGKIAAQRIAASGVALEESKQERQEAQKKFTETEVAEKQVQRLLKELRVSRQLAASDRAKAKVLHQKAMDLFADTVKAKRQNETDRTQLEQSIASAQSLIDDAEAAQIEAANARIIVEEVNSLVVESRENREAAEQALEAAERVRKVSVAEKKAARTEQLAATSAIEAAATEKEAARNAVAAAKIAKQQIDEERLVISQEHAELILAKRESTHERIAAEKAISLAATSEARAKHARLESARQRLFIAERLSVLDAAKEAAEVGEHMAQVARATAAAEHLAAKKARTAAEQAQREAVTEQAFVRDIFNQLRAERFSATTQPEAVKETAGVKQGKTR